MCVLGTPCFPMHGTKYLRHQNLIKTVHSAWNSAPKILWLLLQIAWHATKMWTVSSLRLSLAHVTETLLRKVKCTRVSGRSEGTARPDTTDSRSAPTHPVYNSIPHVCICSSRKEVARPKGLQQLSALKISQELQAPLPLH